MKWEVEFFEGLTAVQSLAKLMKIQIIKRSFINCVLPAEDFRNFKVENHLDRGVLLFNEKYLVFVVTDISNFLISEIKLAVDKMDLFIPIIVQLEENTKLVSFKNNQVLKIEDITNMAVENGVSHKNPFLVFLRILFDKKPY